jgi:hypothetical protein
MMVKSHQDAMKNPIISDMLDVENPWFSKENRPQMDATIYNLLDFPHLRDSFPPGNPCESHGNSTMEPLTGRLTPGPVAGVAGVAGVAVAVRLHGGSSDAMLRRHLGWAQALKHWATWPGWNWIGNWMELAIGNCFWIIYIYNIYMVNIWLIYG